MNREEMSESIGHVELGGSESEHSSHVIYGEPPLYDDSESFEPEEERIANENEAVQFEHQTKSVKVTDHEPSEPSVVYEKTKSIDYEEVSASEPAKHEELVQPRNAFRKIYDMDDLNTFESDVVHGRSSHASASNPDRIVEVGVSSDGSQIPEHNDDHTHTQHVNQPVDHDVQAKHESQLVDDHVQTDSESQSDGHVHTDSESQPVDDHVHTDSESQPDGHVHTDSESQPVDGHVNINRYLKPADSKFDRTVMDEGQISQNPFWYTALLKPFDIFRKYLDLVPPKYLRIVRFVALLAVLLALNALVFQILLPSLCAYTAWAALLAVVWGTLTVRSILVGSPFFGCLFGWNCISAVLRVLKIDRSSLRVTPFKRE
eukprot:40557_1